ncbi:MAG TPA: ribonuclease III [Acholeplasmataceae bacterium]|jgi:ribonuclease-3|nr:ribonuclease III [Acholeplasmataceae bacterium]HRX45473.1 ribonuclease III [Acholeplasmataceae bacterium]
MKAFLEKLHLPYKDESLYEIALTHSSYANENQTEKNEKLEFLGDSVIGILMSDYLYQEDLADEGQMTKRRAQAVCEEALVKYASLINLKDYLRLGRGEMIKGANDAMIADAFEALFGAVYLDLGFKYAYKLFHQLIVPNLNMVWNIKDYKSTLQEFIQAGDKRSISYHIIKETGPSHHKEFEAAVKLDNVITLGIGSGKTKKEAEQNAAKDALKKGNYDHQTSL